jgi:hypothetical protein
MKSTSVHIELSPLQEQVGSTAQVNATLAVVVSPVRQYQGIAL